MEQFSYEAEEPTFRYKLSKCNSVSGETIFKSPLDDRKRRYIAIYLVISHRYGQWSLLIGKSSITLLFSIAILYYRRW